MLDTPAAVVTAEPIAAAPIAASTQKFITVNTRKPTG